MYPNKKNKRVLTLLLSFLFVIEPTANSLAMATDSFTQPTINTIEGAAPSQTTGDVFPLPGDNTGTAIQVDQGLNNSVSIQETPLIQTIPTSTYLPESTNPIQPIAPISSSVQVIGQDSNQVGDTASQVAPVVHQESISNLVVQLYNKDKQGLEGANFSLYSSQEVLLGEKTTDSLGRADFGKLQVGSYILRETNPPQGYANSDQAFGISVGTDGQILWAKNPSSLQGRDLNTQVSVQQYGLHNNYDKALLGGTISIEGKVQEGDFFNVFLDSKLSGGSPRPILNQNGLPLAEGIYDPYTHTYKYVFTRLAQDLEIREVAFSIGNLQMNTQEMETTGNREFLNRIGTIDQYGVLLDPAYGSPVAPSMETETILQMVNYQDTSIDQNLTTGETNIIQDLITDPTNVLADPVSRSTNLQMSPEAVAADLLGYDPNNVVLSGDVTGQPMIQSRSLSMTMMASPTGGYQTADLTIKIADAKTGQAIVGAQYAFISSISGAGSTSTPVTSDANGVISLTNLNPGSYSLIETKMPEGYTVDTQKVTNFVVTESGSVEMGAVEVKPYEGAQDISSSLVFTQSLTVDPSPIGPNTAFKYKARVEVPESANEGDYFYLTMSDTLVHNQLEPSRPVSDYIYDPAGNIIAIMEQTQAVQDPASSTGHLTRIKYTLTAAGANLDNVVLDINHNHNLRREVVRDNGDYTFSYSLAGDRVSETRTVQFPNITQSPVSYYGSKPKLNMTTRFINLVDQQEKYSQVIYVNPLGENYGGDGMRLYIRPNSNTQYGPSSAQIDPNLTSLRVYKVDANNGTYINDSISPDLTGLSPMTSGYTFNFDQNGGLYVNIPNVGNSTYIVMVDSQWIDDPSRLLLQSVTLNAMDSKGNVLATTNATRTDGIQTTSAQSGAVSENTPGDFTFSLTKEPVTKGRFEILKTDSTSQAKPLPGASFTLSPLDASGNKVTDPNQQRTIVSQADGRLVFDNISQGQYILEETVPPQGYRGATSNWKMRISFDGKTFMTENLANGTSGQESEVLEPIKISNEKIKAKLSLHKIDTGTKAPLEGVEFRLSGYSAENKVNTTERALSDKDGNLSFDQLEVPGYYLLEEIKTLEGYSLVSNSWILHTTLDASQPGGYKIEVYNTDKREPIVPHVVHGTIEGAWARVNDQGKYIDQAGNVLDTVSGATIKPENLNEWIASPTPQPKTLVANQMEVGNGRGQLIVNKKDELGNPLDHAEFTLSLKDQASGAEMVESSVNGQAVFDSLEPGKSYTLKETKAPLGYKGTTDTWTVTVASDGTVSITKDGAGEAGDPTADLTASTNKQSDSTAPGLSTEITNVDLDNKTFTMKITLSTGGYYTAYSQFALSGDNLGQITQVSSSQDSAFIESGTGLIKTSDTANRISASSSPTVITVTGTYSDNSKPLAITTAYKGNYYNGTAWIFDKQSTLTSTVPISGGTSGLGIAGDPIETNGNDGNLGYATFTSGGMNTGYYVGAKVTQVDRQKNTFEAVVYANYSSLPEYVDATNLSIGPGAGSSLKTITSMKVYDVIGDFASSMPSSYNVDLADTSKYTFMSSTSPSTSAVSTKVDDGSGAPQRVIKISGTYDPSLGPSISLQADFTGKVYYYSSTTQRGGYYSSIGSVSTSFTPSPWTDPGDTSTDNGSAESSIGKTADGLSYVNVTNTKEDLKGKFTIKKTDGKDGKALGGVKFLLTRIEDGATFNKETDGTGAIAFDKLAPGKYILKEVATLEGYIKIDKEWYVYVANDGKTYVSSNSNFDNVQADPGTTTSTEKNTVKPTYNGSLNEATRVSKPNSTSDPLYPSYGNPIYYDSIFDGKYPRDFDQTMDTLRNAFLTDGTGKNYGGYLTYRGNYEKQLSTGTVETDVAHVAKYGEKYSTDPDNTYNITLKVKGNTYPEKKEDKLGVILLYDNSNSMGQWDYYNGVAMQKVDIAKAATADFINAVEKTNPDVDFALFTYGSFLFDGKSHAVDGSPNADYYFSATEVGDYTQETFTGNPSTIINLLPDTVPMDYYGGVSRTTKGAMGGTYTGGALLEAEKLIEAQKANYDRIVVINITDGVPTRSPIVAKYDYMTKESTFYPRNDYSLASGVYTHGIKGRGNSYYMTDSSDGYYGGYYDSYGTWVPRQYYSYWDGAYYASGYGNITNHGQPTIMAADNVKNTGAEIYNIGIGINGENFTTDGGRGADVSKSTAQDLMLSVSSGLSYNYDAQNGDQIAKALSVIANQLYRDTIVSGMVTDPMGDKVDLVLGDDGLFKPEDYSLKAYKDGVEDSSLLVGVTPKYDSLTRTISLQGLNLGLGEEVVLTYKVALRVDDPTVADNVYYETNKDTYLYPNTNEGNVRWHFPIPSVQKLGTEPPHVTPNIDLENYTKPTMEFIKKTLYGGTLTGATFQLERADDQGNWTSFGDPIQTRADGKVSLPDLDKGNYRLMETQTPIGYEKPEEAVATFTVTEDGQVTNLRVQGRSMNPDDEKPIINLRKPEMNINLLKLGGDKLPILENKDISISIYRAPSNTTGASLPDDKTKTISEGGNTFTFKDLKAIQENGGSLRMSFPLEIFDSVVGQSKLIDGLYYIEESSAPDGYLGSRDKFFIDINQKERTIKLVKVTDSSGTVEKEYMDKGLLSQTGPITLFQEGDLNPINLEIINIRPEYPATGGLGTLGFSLVGSTLMALSAGIYLSRKKTRPRA